MSAEENKAIVGRWFTEFWGKEFNLGGHRRLAAPDIRFEYSLHPRCAAGTRSAADPGLWIMAGPPRGWAQVTRRLLWSTPWSPAAPLPSPPSARSARSGSSALTTCTALRASPPTAAPGPSATEPSPHPARQGHHAMTGSALFKLALHCPPRRRRCPVRQLASEIHDAKVEPPLRAADGCLPDYDVIRTGLELAFFWAGPDDLQCLDLCRGQGLLEDLDVVDTAGKPVDVLAPNWARPITRLPVGGVGGGVCGGALWLAVDVEPQLTVGGVVDADEVDPGIQHGRAGRLRADGEGVTLFAA